MCRCVRLYGVLRNNHRLEGLFRPKTAKSQMSLQDLLPVSEGRGLARRVVWRCRSVALWPTSDGFRCRSTELLLTEL